MPFPEKLQRECIAFKTNCVDIYNILRHVIYHSNTKVQCASKKLKTLFQNTVQVSIPVCFDEIGVQDEAQDLQISCAAASWAYFQRPTPLLRPC